MDGKCCRGQRRSRFPRAAGSGGILGEVKSLRPTKVAVTKVNAYYEGGKNTALGFLAPCSPSQFHAEGLITYDTAYSLSLSDRNPTCDELFYSVHHSKGDLGRLAS